MTSTAAELAEKAQRRGVPRPSRGTIIAPLTAGETAGKPVSELAYITPNFPRGIKNSDLQLAASSVQRETALWWFYLNLEPHDLSKGGPYLALSGAIGGTAIGRIGGVAPGPVAALTALTDEFGGIIADEIITELGQALGTRWMWIRTPHGPSKEPTSFGETISLLRSTLDELAEHLHGLELTLSYGGIGHNGPPEATPMSSVERDETLSSISLLNAEAEAFQNGSLSIQTLTSTWATTKPTMDRIGKWAISKQTDLFSEVAVEAINSIGKKIPHIVIGLGTIWLLSCEISLLLEKLQYLGSHVKP